MEKKFYFKCVSALLVLLLFAVNVFSQVPVPPVPTISGPLDAFNLPATLSGGITTGQVYTTEPGMEMYGWTVSTSGVITSREGTNSITVDWTNPTSQQSVSVTYTDPASLLSAVTPTVLIINYFPFSPAIDPTVTPIPQFVDPLPHFAAGLRVNAKAGGNLLIKAVPVRQIALPTGTVLANGTIGDPATPNAGMGNYAAYAISKDNGVTFGPAMWPAQTIEAQVGNQLIVKYENDMFGKTYIDFNILADQTLMMNGFPKTGVELTDPYTGPIPMVTHLHGGEMPSNSDGGPTGWFMPGYSQFGPGFAYNASSTSTYPNQQEEGTLWYHPHDQGLTRINVYTGLAGYYFLRGPNEEAAHLPGWSGDDLVQEVTPTDIARTPTFNGSNTYLPEIEVAIQDRMFNDKGELYWPVAPTNPDKHPFWTPEFFGNIMTVNGKAWPYLSVAPRKYRFRLLDGCNARFLNVWLQDLANGTAAPAITIIGSDGGLYDTPKTLAESTLLMSPGERYDVVIDFTNLAGKVFTLMNNASAPYPTGSPVVAGDGTDKIMQFVVNGNLVSANGGIPADKSLYMSPSTNLRPVHPMVKLTDFAGNLAAGVVPAVKRQIILNEVTDVGGPVQVLFNNTHLDVGPLIAGAPLEVGGPSEMPLEGTTEQISIINTTVDAHPIHIHLMQWQLVSRQAFDVSPTGYMAAYKKAWATRGVPEWPAGQGYPGSGGPPNDYSTTNGDGAVGGNPAISPFFVGPVIPATPEEMGWKDDIKSFPGEVATYIVRAAPTDRPVNATQAELMFPFDPSIGPGYVWHCHIIDHEDMDMMRPLMIRPSVLRYPQITIQPASVVACAGGAASFSVTATSATPISYQWQVSTDLGVPFVNVVNSPVYSGATTSKLTVSPLTIAPTIYRYQVVMTNIDGITISNAADLTVNPLPVPVIAGNNSLCAGTTDNVYATEPGKTGYTWTVSSGGTVTAGGTTADNTVTVTWLTAGARTVSVNYSNLGCSAASPTVFKVDVKPLPVVTLKGASPVCANSVTGNIYTTEAGMTNYIWSVSAGGTITAGGDAVSNTITIVWKTAGAQTVSVNYTNATGCSASAATILNVTVNPIPVVKLTGSAAVCLNSSAVYTTDAAMTNYVWTISAGGLITAGGTSTSNTVTVKWNVIGPQTVAVNYANGSGCSAELPTQLNVTVNPLPEVTLNGPTPVCINSTGNVYTTEPGMTNYVWVVSAGGTITAGGTSASNSVTVKWTTLGAKTVSVNYTSRTGCPAALPTVLNIKNSNSVAVGVSITASSSSVFTGTPVTFTAIPDGGGKTPVYQWYKNGVAAGSNLATFNFIPVNGDVVYVAMISSLTCVTGNPAKSNSINMSVIPGPPTPASVSVAASLNNICKGTSVTFTPTPVGGGTAPAYQWFKNNVAVVKSATYTYVPANGDIVYVVMTPNYSGVTGSPVTSNSIGMIVNSPLAKPGNFTTSTSIICEGGSNAVYTVPNVPGVIYSWTYSGTGATITGTSNSVLVSYSAVATSGTLSVTGSNVCGASPARSIYVLVKALPGQPADFTVSSSSVTQGACNVVYTIPNVGGMTYSWSYSGTGATIKGTKNSILVSFSTIATSGVLSVTAVNSCGVSIPRTLAITVNPLPDQPGQFTAFTSSICGNQSNVVYTVPFVAGVTYNWSYSGTGATLTGSSNSVSVNFLNATSGTLRVTASNGFGTSAPRALTITVSSPAAQPDAFTTASASVCQGENYVAYTVPNVAGVEYKWTYSGKGAGFIGKFNSVLVSFAPDATSGNLSVTASNGCGTSIERTMGITVNPAPVMPKKFTASVSSVSQGQTGVIYTVPLVAGLTYNWTYWGTGATITGTSNSVSVDFSATATSGTLVVTTSNGCGTSLPLGLAITVVPVLKSAKVPVVVQASVLTANSVTVVDALPAKNELKAFPNPSSGPVVFEFQISTKAKAILDIMSNTGQSVARLYNQEVEPGKTQTVIYEEYLAPGIYFYSLRWNDQSISGKLIITQ